MEDKSKPLRDSINGKNMYVRIPIQRKRTPICEKEILEFEKLQTGFNVDLETLGRLACIISDFGFPHFAGKLFSFIDMKNGKEYEHINFL